MFLELIGCLLVFHAGLSRAQYPVMNSPFIQNPHQLQAYLQYMSKENAEETSTPAREVCGPYEQEKIKECADPLYKMGAISEDTNSLGWEGFLYRTKAYFSEVCDNFFIFDVCIEPYKDICFAVDSARFKYDAALKVLDFLCRDGYGEMIRNIECFTRTLTRAEMMQCQAELVADTRKISETRPDAPTQNAAVCGAMRNYVDCVKYPIRYECGYRAWQLVRELIVRPTRTLLPTCQLSSASSLHVIFHTHSIVLLVAVWYIF